jgi:cyanophycinase
MRNAIVLGATLAALACAAPAHAAPGSLVIAGGAVSRDNEQVHRAFIDRVGPTGRIAIIPAASGDPAQAAASYISTLERYGVSRERIDVVAVAVMDDGDTTLVDEASWANNGTSPEEVAKIAGASGIWMVGGDQARITRVLLGAAGTGTPMLAAMRERLGNGAVIGGTSAGAAVMSAIMIARGDSLNALLQRRVGNDATSSTMDGGDLVLSSGLGFVPLGLVDQHFDRKARLGRLTRALGELPAASRIGYGVDEDTALVIDLARDEASVAGHGTVVILDGRAASFATNRRRFAASGLTLSMISSGDRMSMSTLEITAAPFKRRITAGREYYTHAPQSGTGMALPNPELEPALGVELLDNSNGRTLERVSFDASGRGVRYRFEETTQSWGAFGNGPDGSGRYTASGIAFSIEPLRVRIRPDR